MHAAAADPPIAKPSTPAKTPTVPAPPILIIPLISDADADQPFSVFAPLQCKVFRRRYASLRNQIAERMRPPFFVLPACPVTA